MIDKEELLEKLKTLYEREYSGDDRAECAMDRMLDRVIRTIEDEF